MTSGFIQCQGTKRKGLPCDQCGRSCQDSCLRNSSGTVCSYLPGSPLFSDVSTQFLSFLLLLPQSVQRFLELLLWERNHNTVKLWVFSVPKENKWGINKADLRRDWFTETVIRIYDMGENLRRWMFSFLLGDESHYPFTKCSLIFFLLRVSSDSATAKESPSLLLKLLPHPIHNV